MAMTDEKSTLICGDSLVELKKIKNESVDLVVTSPPYDNLRTYNGNITSWNFEKFQLIALQLYRIVKRGGVVVWVVADATINGSETGTSFKQALYFKEIGFNLHDTMIYRKTKYVPLTHNRYEQEFEYIFVFSKGRPKTFNPIMIPCKFAGNSAQSSFHKTNDSGLVTTGKRRVKDFKIKGNVFDYCTNKSKDTAGHPAPFPEELVKDNIQTWSNEGDVVLDCFMGSGTTGKVARDLNRFFIGIEIDNTYYEISIRRIQGERR